MFYENEAQSFGESMYDSEAALQDQPDGKSNWENFENESEKLWKELEAESDDYVSNWMEAFQLNPMACIAMKEQLESYLK